MLLDVYVLIRCNLDRPRVKYCCKLNRLSGFLLNEIGGLWLHFFTDDWFTLPYQPSKSSKRLFRFKLRLQLVHFRMLPFPAV